MSSQRSPEPSEGGGTGSQHTDVMEVVDLLDETDETDETDDLTEDSSDEERPVTKTTNVISFTNVQSVNLTFHNRVELIKQMFDV